MGANKLHFFRTLAGLISSYFILHRFTIQISIVLASTILFFTRYICIHFLTLNRRGHFFPWIVMLFFFFWVFNFSFFKFAVQPNSWIVSCWISSKNWSKVDWSTVSHTANSSWFFCVREKNTFFFLILRDLFEKN